MWHSILLSCNLNSSSSVYTTKNTGDSTPHCLTPFMTVKESDITLPHLTLNVWFVYINNINDSYLYAACSAYVQEMVLQYLNHYETATLFDSSTENLLRKYALMKAINSL